jgi:Zn-dependent peptidase ImmA (M78 family)
MPTIGLRRRVSDIREASQKKLPISDVLRVAHRYGVSPQALVRHLEELRELPLALGIRCASGFRFEKLKNV